MAQNSTDKSLAESNNVYPVDQPLLKFYQFNSGVVLLYSRKSV